MSSLGEIIRAERKNSGLTMRQLAIDIGVSIMTLQRIEVNKVDPSVDLVVKIAHSLKRPLSIFINDREPFFYHQKASKHKTDKEDWQGAAKLLLPPGILETGAGIMMIESENGTDLKVDIANQGKICGYVIAGKMELDYINGKHLFNSGDVFGFDSSKSKSLSFKETGKVIIWQIW